MDTHVRKNQELAYILEVSRVLTGSFDLEQNHSTLPAAQAAGQGHLSAILQAAGQ